MKKFLHIATLVLCVILAVSCSPSKPSDPDDFIMPEPKFTAAPSELPKGEGTPKGMDLVYVKGNADIAAVEAITMGLLNEFVEETELIYLAKSMDLNTDGSSDLVLALSQKTYHDELFSAYYGNDEFVNIKILLGLKEGGFSLFAENKSMLKTDMFNGLAKGSIESDGATLVISNIQEVSDGYGLLQEQNSEEFHCIFSMRDNKLYLSKLVTTKFSAPDFLHAQFIEDSEENIGRVEFSTFSRELLVSDMINDDKREEVQQDGYFVTKLFPEFKLIDKAREAALVRFVDEGFTQGIDAMNTLGNKKDVTIDCKKVFQNDLYISFVYTVKDNQSGATEFAYSKNLLKSDYKDLKINALMSSNQLKALFDEQERYNTEHYGTLTTFMGNEENLTSALAAIDDKTGIAKNNGLFSRFTDKNPYIYVSNTNGDINVITLKPDPNAKSDITVKNADEFVAALGSNRKIKLTPGIYNLSSVSASAKLENGVSFVSCFDGYQLELRGLENLTIEGNGAEIVVEPRYADVLSIKNCKNIVLTGLKLGHSENKGACQGAVLGISDSSAIRIGGCILYGSGTMGIDAFSVNYLECQEVVIEGCSEAILNLTSVKNAKFTSCSFKDNEGYNMMPIISSSNISFEKCSITNNKSLSDSNSFFMISGSKSVSFKNTSITGNTGKQQKWLLFGVEFSSITSNGNTFSVDHKYEADDLSAGDLNLGEIHPGQTLDEIKNLLLGLTLYPDAKIKGDTSKYDSVYNYSNIDLGFKGDKLYGIKTDDPEIKTTRGIKAGMSVEDLYDQYGYTEIKDGMISYPLNVSYGNLSEKFELCFYISNSRIDYIGFRFKA